MTLGLMMLHHHTKFGNKMFCDSGNIQTNIPDTLNLRCNPDLKHSNLIFQQDTPASDAVLPNQDWMQTHQQIRRDNRNSHILTI